MAINSFESPVTKSLTSILKEFKSSSVYPAYSKHGKLNDGDSIVANEVYAAYSGTVMIFSTTNNLTKIVVQTGKSFCISYSKLSETAEGVKLGSVVSQGDHLGNCRGEALIEYYDHNVSPWIVRIGQTTWYKNDPEDVLSGNPIYIAPVFSAPNIIELSDYPSGDGKDISEEGIYIMSDNTGGEV